MRATRQIVPVVLAVATVANVGTPSGEPGAQASHRFIVVSGDGYEGAIIPAEYVPASHVDRGWAAWTPTKDDVTRFETEVRLYFERASRAPGSAKPPFRTSGRPEETAEVRRLASTHGKFRRQYFATFRGADRRVELTAFLESARTGKWADELVRPPFDSACGFWFMTFDATRLRIVEAGCGGSA
jgi:hypothetical protein